jgi:hypothetical protein
MSARTAVYCREGRLVTVDDLIAEMRQSVFCETPVRFDPPDGSGSWQVLQAFYQADKHPVVIRHHVEDAQVRAQIEEAHDRLAATAATHLAPTVLEHLAAARQTFELELDEWGATEDAWTMAAALQAELAHSLDGLILANEGIYDAQRKLICRAP